MYRMDIHRGMVKRKGNDSKNMLCATIRIKCNASASKFCGEGYSSSHLFAAVKSRKGRKMPGIVDHVFNSRSASLSISWIGLPVHGMGACEVRPI